MESVEEPRDRIQPVEASVSDVILVEDQEYVGDDGDSNADVQIQPDQVKSDKIAAHVATKNKRVKKRGKRKAQKEAGPSENNELSAKAGGSAPVAPPMKILPAVDEAGHTIAPAEVKLSRKQLKEKLRLQKRMLSYANKEHVFQEVIQALKAEIIASDGVRPIQPIPDLDAKDFHKALVEAMREFNADNGFHLIQSPPLTDLKDFTPDELDFANYNKNNTWSTKKRWEVLNKLRGLPKDQLTLDHLNLMVTLSGFVKVQLDSPFRAHRKQLRASRWKAMKSIGCALLHPPPFTEVQEVTPEELDSAAVKACGEVQKWAILNKLRGIPIHLLNRHHFHIIDQLCTLLNVQMDSAIWHRRKELITDKKVAQQLEMLSASQAPKEVVLPPPVQHSYDGAVMAFATATKQEEKKRFAHIMDFPADCGEYKKWPQARKRNLFDKLNAIPLEELTREACHKMGTLAIHLKVKLPESFNRRRDELKKKNVKNAPPVIPPGQPLPVLGAQPSFHPSLQNHSESDRRLPQLMQQPSMNPIAFSQPAPPGPYGQFPPQFQQQPGPWGPQQAAFNIYPPMQFPMNQQYQAPIPPNYAQQEWMMHQQQLQEQERMRQQQEQERMMHMQQQEYQQHQQYQQLMEPMESNPAVPTLTRAQRKKRGKEIYSWKREPSPKRMREAPPPLQPPEVKLPLAELANSDNYILEEPRVKAETIYRNPVTVQDMQALSDLVSLCRFRDAPAVYKPFVHPASRVILDRICDYLGRDQFKLEEECTSKTLPNNTGVLERTRYQSSVWISGFSRLITLGEGVDLEHGQATKFAYASAMAALCYMMIIPYQLFLVITKSGPDHVDLILYTCKQRIRHMIAVSRESVFSPLSIYNGGLEVPEYIRDLWGTFINRMRHSGMDLWDSSPVVTVPRHMTTFTGKDIENFYFKCERDEQIVHSWVGMAPIRGEIVTFDEAEYNRTYACSRFMVSPAERGIIPKQFTAPNNMDFPPNDAYSYQLRHKHPQVNPKNYDPVVHMPFRDLLCSHGIGSRSIPRLSYFLLKYIGSRWNRQLVVKYTTEMEVKDGKERWKHVVSLSFEGVPFFFLGGRCRRDNFSSALLNAGAIIAEQLANMMIIPRELCYFLEKQGRDWAAVVIYVCRERFAAFEALVRNPMYLSLHSLSTAEVNFKNPLYKLAESFFWRMRCTGFPYWVDHGKKLMVPISFGHKPLLPQEAFFKFEATYQTPTWEAINASFDRVDNFELSSLSVADRQWTVWEDGDRVDEEEQEVVTPEPSLPQLGSVALTPGMMFENALNSDYHTSLAALSTLECEVVLKFLLTLAASNKKKGLEMKTTKDLTPAGREYFRCRITWSGNLSWILNASYDSDSERNLQFGAAWTLYKMLVEMAIVPPGLFKFIGNNDIRLPFVVASIVPFLNLLETQLPMFKNHPDAENNRGLLMEHMRQVALMEWQYRTIQLPPHLMPCSEEQRRLPFIRVEAMSPRTQDNWKTRGDSKKYGKVAKVVDERGRDVNQLAASKPQPGIKISSRFTTKAKGAPGAASSQRLPIQGPLTPPEPAREEEKDYDTDEELAELEELCNAPQGPPMPASAASSTYYNYRSGADNGEDEFL